MCPLCRLRCRRCVRSTRCAAADVSARRCRRPSLCRLYPSPPPMKTILRGRSPPVKTAGGTHHTTHDDNGQSYHSAPLREFRQHPAARTTIIKRRLSTLALSAQPTQRTQQKRKIGGGSPVTVITTLPPWHPPAWVSLNAVLYRCYCDCILGCPNRI